MARTKASVRAASAAYARDRTAYRRAVADERARDRARYDRYLVQRRERAATRVQAVVRGMQARRRASAVRRQRSRRVGSMAMIRRGMPYDIRREIAGYI